ncbi:hypothetical protein T06_3299 [Trichinella sp. T6]|nr:hypothetical protein T06_3299 [Trichinella sp. T6]
MKIQSLKRQEIRKTLQMHFFDENLHIRNITECSMTLSFMIILYALRSPAMQRVPQVTDPTHPAT